METLTFNTEMLNSGIVLAAMMTIVSIMGRKLPGTEDAVHGGRMVTGRSG